MKKFCVHRSLTYSGDVVLVCVDRVEISSVDTNQSLQLPATLLFIVSINLQRTDNLIQSIFSSQSLLADTGKDQSAPDIDIPCSCRRHLPKSK